MQGEKDKSLKKLTDKEELFLQHYLSEGVMNGAKAAKLAGYSEGSAKQQAYLMLKKPHIQRRKAEMMTVRAKALEISANDVLIEIYNLAMGNLQDVISWKDGQITLIDSEKMPRAIAASIASIKEGQYGLEVKLHKKEVALGLLMDHLGLKKQQGVDLNDLIGQLTQGVSDANSGKFPRDQVETGSTH